MPTLDPCSLPLAGRHLVEASAGTGKTWTIGMLFLRLVVESGLSVDRILVVTYTRAATGELRDRLRRRLRDALAVLEGARPKNDPELVRLVLGWPDAAAARTRLDTAVRDFDLAPVLTIHSFCQRALRDNAFESGTSFDVELLESDEAFVAEAAQDLWTRHLWQADRAFVDWIGTQLSTRDVQHLVRLATRAAKVRVLPPLPAPVPGASEGFRAAVEAARAAWLTPEGDRRAEVVAALLAPRVLKGTSYGARTVETRAARVAEALRAGRLSLTDADVWKAVGSFTSEAMAQQLLAKADPSQLPQHPAFEACAALVEAAEQLGASFEAQRTRLCHTLLAEAPEALLRVKGPAREGRFFDDLIGELAGALARPVEGARLAEALRSRFPAALIDEFQDTDPVQWEVFRAIHPASTEGSLFLIGDPKQAIYAFRGADLHTYLAAAEEIGEDRRWQLEVNWRSDGPLVAAVHALFERPERPFVARDVHYPTVRAHHASPRLLWSGAPRAPLSFRVHASPTSRGPSTSAVPGSVAAEIVALLSAPITVEEGPIRPEHVAVLVHSHKDGAAVQEALRRRGVPSVRYGAQTVLGAPERLELLALLEAIVRPNDVRALRGALVTPLLGATAHDLHALEVDEGLLQQRMQRVRAWRDTWDARGFMRMLQRVLLEEGVLPRLLATDGGDRRITNYRHLAELVHAAEQERGLKPLGCISWLARQGEGGGETGGNDELRLESDAAAVQIVTMHASKGLEYPVVFLPYLWKSPLESSLEVFHDPEAGEALTLHLSPDVDPRVRALRYEEARAEALRLAYVALTRARHLCVVHWGAFFSGQWWKFNHSPLAHLLHPPGPGEHVGANAEAVKALDDAALMEALRELARSAPELIRVDWASEPELTRWSSAEPPAVLRPEPPPLVPQGPDVRLSSYSGLVKAAHEAPERDMDALRTPAVVEEAAEIVLAEFPRGANPGSAYHLVLEHLDFPACTEAASLEPSVRAHLAVHGLAEPAWVSAVARSVVDVVGTPLGEGAPRLLDVHRAHRLDELEFMLSVGEAEPLDAARLARAFEEGLPPSLAAPVARRLASLDFKPVQGALKGFVDLTFRHEGRWWLVDYKTNHLGGRWSDYAPERLDAAMIEGDYVLQYHLYAVALRRWLRLRVHPFDWDRDFGGVRYLFVRGMRPDLGATRGVFVDRPDAARLDRLDAALGGGRS